MQFLVLGGIIFLVFGLNPSDDGTETDRRIAVDGPTQAWLYDTFSKQFRRPPTRSEMEVLIQSHVDDEVKYREALALGLDDRDSIVRRRLMQKFDFLFGDAGTNLNPIDEELEGWYEEHAERFMVSATVSFTHRWFSPDDRGASAEADALSALSALRAGETIAGDSFPFSLSYEAVNRAAVRRSFGPDFAAAVFDAPFDEWSGPIESGLGFHTVRVTQKTKGIAPPLDEVREAALDAWRREESKRVLAATLSKLRSDYTIEIDEAATGQFDYSIAGENDAK